LYQLLERDVCVKLCITLKQLFCISFKIYFKIWVFGLLKTTESRTALDTLKINVNKNILIRLAIKYENEENIVIIYVHEIKTEILLRLRLRYVNSIYKDFTIVTNTQHKFSENNCANVYKFE
jgi:hypothetical protein